MLPKQARLDLQDSSEDAIPQPQASLSISASMELANEWSPVAPDLTLE